MSETKHTPTPWQVKHPDREPWYVIGNIDGPDDGRWHYDTICDCDQDSRSSMDLEESKANAAFIVEAVNNHERLTQRVQELEKALRIARGRMAHRFNCVKVNPTETWHVNGSVTVGACICEIATVDAALAGAQKEATK